MKRKNISDSKQNSKIKTEH